MHTQSSHPHFQRLPQRELMITVKTSLTKLLVPKMKNFVVTLVMCVMIEMVTARGDEASKMGGCKYTLKIVISWHKWNLHVAIPIYTGMTKHFFMNWNINCNQVHFQLSWWIPSKVTRHKYKLSLKGQVIDTTRNECIEPKECPNGKLHVKLASFPENHKE